MSEFEELTKNQFFVIDSENLDKIESRLYGFALSDDGKIIKNDNLTDSAQISGCGTFVWVKVSSSKIVIEQDFNGCYGLYLFKEGDYFALSNSFWKLVEYLGGNHNLSLNNDFATAFISADLCSFAYQETLANEIEMLPRDCKVIIDNSARIYEIQNIDYKENTVDIDSKEGIELLDKWFFRWTNIIRSLKAKTNNIVADLTGGFDSRVVLTLFLNADIDLTQVKFNSATDNKHCHAEDFEIASSIAKHFGFELNNKVLRPYPLHFIDVKTVLDISFYVKLGFHKQLYYKYAYNQNPLYVFPGNGGECIRGYPYKTASKYRDEVLKCASVYGNAMEKASQTIFDSVLERIKVRFGIEDPNSTDIPMHQYTEIRCRNHYGKAMVGNVFVNTFNLTPLIDPELRRLKLTDPNCQDKKLLIALIYNRYCPDLLKFKFEGKRFIDQSTIDYAKKINQKYVFTPVKQDIVSYVPEKNEVIYKQDPNLQYVKVGEPDAFIRKVFSTKKFRELFCSYFPAATYDRILASIPLKNYFPLDDVYACLGSLCMAVTCSKQKETALSNSEWMEELMKLTDNDFSWIYKKYIMVLGKIIVAQRFFKRVISKIRRILGSIIRKIKA